MGHGRQMVEDDLPYYVVLLLPLILLTGAAMRLVDAPFSSRAATHVLTAFFAIVVVHEISATAQVYGALLTAGMIVFVSCWYWLWRSGGSRGSDRAGDPPPFDPNTLH